MPRRVDIYDHALWLFIGLERVDLKVHPTVAKPLFVGWTFMSTWFLL